MKKNHAAKRIVGTISIILGIVVLLIGGLCVFLYLNPQVIDEFDKFLVETLNLKNPDGTTPQSSKIELPTAISTPILGAVFLLFGIILKSFASDKAIAKMHDVFGFKRYRPVHIKLWWIFLGLGFIVECVAFVFYHKYQPIAEIALCVGGGMMVIGLIMLIPMPSNFIVKRKYKDNTVTISWPKNGLCAGKFSPSAILNELSAASAMGYRFCKKIYGNEDLSGKVKIVMENTTDSKEQIKKNRDDFMRLAMKALKKDHPIESPFFVEEYTHEGPRKKEVTTTTRSVNDYDTITTYGDGHKEVEHHYKTITSVSVSYYKNLYTEYVFRFRDGDNEYTVADEEGVPLSLLVYKGRKNVD